MSEHLLFTFQRAILRRMYGPIQGKGGCRPRCNSKIYNLYKDLNVADDIKIIRLEWGGGNISSVEDDRIPKKRFLLGNFILQDQWEKQGGVGRTSAGETHHRP